MAVLVHRGQDDGPAAYRGEHELPGQRERTSEYVAAHVSGLREQPSPEPGVQMHRARGGALRPPFINHINVFHDFEGVARRSSSS